VKGQRAAIALALLALLGTAFAVGFELRARALTPAAPAPPGTVNVPLRQQVLAVLRSHYYRRLPAAITGRRTVTGVLAELRDPYTRYLTPGEYGALRRAEAGTYAGIGVTVSRTTRGLRVTAALPGLGHRRLGLGPGDVITTIDGTSLATLSYRRALDLITGQVGTAVHLQVIPSGGGPARQVVLRRRTLAAPFVVARTLRTTAGRYRYVRLLGFPSSAGAAIRREAEAAVRHHAAGLILDLRGNPGGLLSQAVSVSRVFVNHGVVLETRGLHEPRQDFFANGTAVRGLRLAVLVDASTASAAEATAGALRLGAGAIVVGARSYGKGTVQAVEPLLGGGAVKLTVAQFLLAGGVPVEGRGIMPDVRIEGDADGNAALRAAEHALASV
jgi:carboxyl-terminal processing protease